VIVQHFDGIRVLSSRSAAFELRVPGLQPLTVHRGAVETLRPNRFITLARGLHCIRQSVEAESCIALWVDPKVTRPNPAPCPAEQLTARYSGSAVAMTGENSAFVTITNRGPQVCLLSGYPDVQLLDGTSALPFAQQHHGQYLDGYNRGIRSVSLGPSQTANLFIAKYRCDIHELKHANAIELAVQGVDSPLTARLPSRQSGPDLAYCKAVGHRRDSTDPGNTILVSHLGAGPGPHDR
jgi:hypothetical protein